MTRGNAIMITSPISPPIQESSGGGWKLRIVPLSVKIHPLSLSVAQVATILSPDTVESKSTTSEFSSHGKDALSPVSCSTSENGVRDIIDLSSC